MASKTLSIEIGVNTTRLCLVDYRVKTPKVYKYARLATPQGVLNDGEITATPEFVQAVRQTISANRMKCKQAVFTITSSKIANREITIPLVKEKKIDALVRANASDYFPIDLSQYELGYILMGRTTAPGSTTQQYRVQVMAAPSTLIDSYRNFAAACGMEMIAADYSGNSVYQVVRGDCTEGVQMVVKVDEKSSIITVLKDQSIALQRSISYGIDEAVQTIIDNEGFGVYNYADALELAVRKTCMKYTFSPDSQTQAAPDSPDDETEDLDLADAKYQVSASLRSLIGNIGRIMEYYASRNGGEHIDKIYVTGMGADFSGFTRLMTNELGVKSVGLQHLEGFHLDKIFKEGHCGEYLTCIGAVIAPVGFNGGTEAAAEKGGKAVKSSSGSDYTGLAVICLIGGTLIGVVLVLVSALNYQSEKERYDSDVNRLNELAEIREIYAEYLATDTAHTQVETLYGMTENHNEDLLNFISEMEQKMPSNISVTTFTTSAETVTISMEVASKEEMANAVQHLRNFDSVADVTVMGVQDEYDEEAGRTVSFTISCTYKTMEQMEADEAAAVEEATETAETTTETGGNQ